MIRWVATPCVVAGQRVVLVSAAPLRPVDPVGEAERGAGDEFGEEVADFVAASHRCCHSLSGKLFRRRLSPKDGFRKATE